jgi:hypothetical protein
MEGIESATTCVGPYSSTSQFRRRASFLNPPIDITRSQISTNVPPASLLPTSSSLSASLPPPATASLCSSLKSWMDQVGGGTNGLSLLLLLLSSWFLHR